MKKMKQCLNMILLVISFCIFVCILFKGNGTQMKYSFYTLVSMILLNISHKLKIFEYGKLKIELSEKIQEANEIIDTMNEYMRALLETNYRFAYSSGHFRDPKKTFLETIELLDEVLIKSDNENDPDIVEIKNNAYYNFITEEARVHPLTSHLFDTCEQNRCENIPTPDEIDSLLTENAYKEIRSNYRINYNEYIDKIK